MLLFSAHTHLTSREAESEMLNYEELSKLCADLYANDRVLELSLTLRRNR
jgi:hypothetical protein